MKTIITPNQNTPFVLKPFMSILNLTNKFLIFRHRPMYTSATTTAVSVDLAFVDSVEPLLPQNKVRYPYILSFFWNLQLNNMLKLWINWMLMLIVSVGPCYQRSPNFPFYREMYWGVLLSLLRVALFPQGCPWKEGEFLHGLLCPWTCILKDGN